MSALDRIIKRDVPETLYHYTSPAGLYGIFTNKSVWATDLHYFNDSSEFFYAIGLTRRIMANDGSFIEEPDFVKIINDYISCIRSIHKFVFSLSECGDLLSQWRGYCPRDGGYAIGFDTCKLKQLLDQNNEFYLYPCEYDLNIQENLIRVILHDTLKKYRQQFLSAATPDTKMTWCYNEFGGQFEVFASAIKSPSWAEEKEWRLTSCSLPNTHPDFRMRVGKHSLIPYLELSLGKTPDQWPFSKVIVGPNSQPELAVDSATSLITTNKISSWEIQCSKVPFRDC